MNTKYNVDRTHWKNLKAFTSDPELENSIFRSSSTTEGLGERGERDIHNQEDRLLSW